MLFNEEHIRDVSANLEVTVQENAKNFRRRHQLLDNSAVRVRYNTQKVEDNLVHA